VENTLLGKKYCYNFKRGKCVAPENPQPFDNFTVYKTRVGSKQRCDACLMVAKAIKKQYFCINHKKHLCVASQNPQPVENFSQYPGQRRCKKCKACEDNGIKFCINFKKGTCLSGQNPLPITSFNARKSGELIGKRNSMCIPCDKANLAQHNQARKPQQRAWTAARKDYHRDKNYKKYYGISLDDYNKMFNEQHGGCAICGKHQSKLKRPLVVDHSHVTGVVRGLLCDKCNLALGSFDGLEKIMQAVDYLKRND